MDIESSNFRAQLPKEEWSFEAWPEQAQDACAPEGGIPAWVRFEMSVAEHWAYVVEASS